MSSFEIRNLRPQDIPALAEAFAQLGWPGKSAEKFEDYLAQQASAQRVVLVAWQDDIFSGYLNVCWQSHYRPFREAGIPEIVDLNVLPVFRQLGIGSRLMDAAEALISAVSASAGIGVGMTADYGAAQRMYFRRGYIPDGRGLMYEGQPINYGKNIPVDDDLCLYLTKELSGALILNEMDSLDQTLPLP